MPRVTRAAARQRDEAEQAAAVPLPNTPVGERAPLGSISGNVSATKKISLVLELEKPAKKAERRGAKKAKAGKKNRYSDSTPEILEDEFESASSSAVEEACEELLRPIKFSELSQIPMHDHDRPLTPPSRAVLRARKQLSPKPRTPHFDPNLHESPNVERSPTRSQGQTLHDRRDSFLEKIEKRSPARLVQPDIPIDEIKQQQKEKEGRETPNNAKMESPVGSPLGMSPYGNRSSRIEDSLEALDAMEDALDEMQESLAGLADQRPQTATTVSLRESLEKVDAAPGIQEGSAIVPETVPSQLQTSSSKVNSKAVKMAPKNGLSSPTRHNASAKRAHKPTTEQIRSSSGTKPSPASKSTTDAKAKRPLAQNPSAIIQARKKPAPIKHSKPATVPSFALPGEAVAARLKAQREARLSRILPASKSTKGTSTRGSTRSSGANTERRNPGVEVPDVRLTAAARARINTAGGKKTASESVSKPRSVTKSVAPSFATRPTAASSTRASRDVVPAPVAEPATKSDPSEERAPQCYAQKSTPTVAIESKSTVIPTANTPVKRASISEEMKPATKADMVLRGSASTASSLAKKAGSARTMTAASLKSQATDKAEAAKRARADAAERGRQASREWAEKMRKRNSALFAAKKAAEES